MEAFGLPARIVVDHGIEGGSILEVLAVAAPEQGDALVAFPSDKACGVKLNLVTTSPSLQDHRHSPPFRYWRLGYG
jgi:hypothetical protein